jgi:Uma2 family endonuclease
MSDVDLFAGTALEKSWTETEPQPPKNGGNSDAASGVSITSPKNDAFHGDICTQLSAALVMFVQGSKLGAVWDSSTGFWMKNRNCRAPDISFVTRVRLQAIGFRRSTRRFFPGAPDLAVEIRSPNNTRRELDNRLRDFFEGGMRLAWIIDLEKQCVEIYRSVTACKLAGVGAFLEGEDLLPGFRYAIADLFKEWEWQ